LEGGRRRKSQPEWLMMRRNKGNLLVLSELTQ
jgi:hypothetical protein